MSSSLVDLGDALKFWKKHKQLPPAPPHSVCQVTPDSVELRQGKPGAWTMMLPPDKIVGVYGYDFRGDALPSVELVDASGKGLRDTDVSVSYVTRYQLNLDFGADSLSQVAPGSRFVLRWPDQPEPNSLAVTLIRPSRLKNPLMCDSRPSRPAPGSPPFMQSP